jgi:hypothetical protein
MRIFSTREVARETKSVFDCAETEDVIVKRGKKIFQIIEKKKVDSKFVSNEWLDEFFQIPAEFQCNPFDVSPSGDLYFADKRNLDVIERSKEQARKGQGREISVDEWDKMCGL